MAFEIQAEKKSVAWMPILIGVFVIAFLAGAVYYLFFAPAPLIESIIGRSDFQKTTDEFSRIKLQTNQETIINNPVFKSLRPQVAPLTTQQTGRSNPWQSF